jgi:uncharacterized repeat protein (TIGR01451 family)
VPGRPGSTPYDLDVSADLGVEKSADPEAVDLDSEVTYELVVTNHGPEPATGVTLVDALPAPTAVSDVQSSAGSCAAAPDGVSCDLGDVAAGATVTVRYVAMATLPGAWANGATVFALEDDPDLTNNSAVAVVEVSAVVDILPGSERNPVRVGRKDVLPVAILGTETFDVRHVDQASLRFGPGGAVPVHKVLAHLEDVDRDGIVDLLSHYRGDEAGLTDSTIEACVQATFTDGRAFRGCDRVTSVPK